MTIGERISKELHDRKITQKELAEKVGISEVTLSRYVNNGRTPRSVTLGRIAKVLGVSSDYLIGIDDMADDVCEWRGDGVRAEDEDWDGECKNCDGSCGGKCSEAGRGKG